MLKNHREDSPVQEDITDVIGQAVAVTPLNQPPHSKIILHTSIGGLCNRLRILCSCLCFSHFWNIPLLLCWDPEDACNCYFHELFDNICEIISPQALLKLLHNEDCSNVLYIKLDMHYFHQEKRLKETLDHDEFEAQYIKFVRQITPKRRILQEIDHFEKQHYWSDNIVGLHIRGTDLYPHLKRKNLALDNFSSIDKFVSAIERELKNGYSRFFLATDDGVTQNLIRSKFPGKIVSYCRDFNRQDKRQTSVENALVDLYLLSRCKKIIGSYYSSFSKYAADLGGISLSLP